MFFAILLLQCLYSVKGKTYFEKYSFLLVHVMFQLEQLVQNKSNGPKHIAFLSQLLLLFSFCLLVKLITLLLKQKILVLKQLLLQHATTQKAHRRPHYGIANPKSQDKECLLGISYCVWQLYLVLDPTLQYDKFSNIWVLIVSHIIPTFVIKE